ncbi:ABC transporter permease [Paludibaculum fermentans]|uniref:ABC transporter permease n=1 Tax=Paludibaculum fermentans TaxID=1473598 RepID=A0A7S7SMJ5_PALFE|nr:ABC transporter permease [Paludibaculum fermentans]QOY89993.1 ABC transporter permease [Paludibaculum fermentans]
MEKLIKDVRHALRMLARSPGFTAVAVAALALGIGANTAIFSVVNGILLQPLPYSEPDRMVRLAMKFPDGNGYSISIPKYVTWKANTPGLGSICAYNNTGPGLNLTGGSTPEQVKGIHVSAGYFQVFDAAPALGRVFSAEEDRPNGPMLAVLSHGLWQRRFGGDPSVIGRVLVMNGEAYSVIGVLRPSFRAYPPAEIFLPLQADPNSTNQGHYLSVAGRLKPGVQIEAVQAQMAAAAERFRATFPKSIGKQESATAEPLGEAMVGDVKKPLLILLGAVALVLLIACANVANLLLARATHRSREVAIRVALGAGRWRIIQQLLTESILLALMGGGAGFVLGAWGVRGLIALSPTGLPRAEEFAQSTVLDWRVLLFSLVVAMGTGILFGLFPALQISRTDVHGTLKEASSRAGTGRRHWARNTLVVTEIALALILLVGAALLIRTFTGLRQVQAGFNPHQVLAFETSLSGSKYKQTAQVEQLSREVVRRLHTVPGVTSAAIVPFLPLEGGFGLGFTVVGRPLEGGAESTGGATWMYVSDEYFKALEIPVVQGRAFTERDTKLSTPVVVVNEAFSKRFWKKGSPMGERIDIGRGMGPDFAEEPREIVGIVGDVKERGLGSDAPPVMYIPLSQLKDSFMALNNSMAPLSWVVKTSVNPLTVSAAVRQQVLEADSGVAVAHVRAMTDVVGESTAREDFNMTLLTLFAAIALLLAAIGVYGMLSYSVQQRAQEIGIRMALGARGADVLKMIVRQGMLLAGLGVVIGLVGAFGLSRLLASLLYGVKPQDPLTFAVVAGVLLLVSLVACWIPAWRAMKVDPVIALRYE